MAGNIFQKERAIVTLESGGASMTNGTAVAATTALDARAAGNFAEDFTARFELLCQWATITGITAGTVVADLYLIPKLDGTNLPDVDVTTGSSKLPYACYVGSFEAQKAPTASTNARFVSPVVEFDPVLYTAYILNKSGQTIATTWTLKAVGAQGQYT